MLIVLIFKAIGMVFFTGSIQLMKELPMEIKVNIKGFKLDL